MTTLAESEPPLGGFLGDRGWRRIKSSDRGRNRSYRS